MSNVSLADKSSVLFGRADDVETSLTLLQAQRSATLRHEDRIRSEVADLTGREAVLVKVEELFKFLLDRYIHQYAESFSALVTEGLQAIFKDQDLSFEIEVSQKGGKVWLDFVTLQESPDGPEVRGSALASFGGGVASVESLILRVLVLLKSGLARYLFLDESLAALSEEYVEAAGTFIRKLCEDLDVNVLLITHNKAFLEHAHTAYHADLGGPANSMVLKELNKRGAK